MSAALRNTRCRTAGGDFDQSGKAAAAASTARLASGREAAGTVAITSPLKGSKSSKVRPSAAPVQAPAMNCRCALISDLVVLIGLRLPALAICQAELPPV